MSNRSFISGTVVFLGGLLAVVTQFLLPPCSAWIETASGMHIPDEMSLVRSNGGKSRIVYRV